MATDQKNTESIRNLMEGIEKGSIVLPEFQRNFVWSVDKTYDLFDSLARNIFIGAIIYGKPSFQITVRELDARPRRGQGSRAKLKTWDVTAEEARKKSKTENFRLVLDGQQRATSIYRALKGYDEIWLSLKHIDELGEGLSHQFEESEEEDMAEFYESLTLEEMFLEFSGHESKDRVSIKLSDVYKMMSSSYRESKIKKEFFNNLIYPTQFSEEESEELFSLYLIAKDKLADLLKDNKLFNYYLLDMDLDKFALFFERSNSRGIQLNFIDILSAKLYTGFKLRKAIESFEDENQSFKPLLQQVVVRTISYIVSNGKELDRSYILKHLDHTHFSAYWEEVIYCYKQTLDFLSNSKFIISQKWMPYENMLIPLILYIRENKGDFSTISESNLDFIKYWYWASIFSARYSGSSNEVIIQDASVLIKLLKTGKITNFNFLNRISRFQITSFDDLFTFSQKRSAIYKGVLNFIYYVNRGFTGWQNSEKLSLNSKLEDHHIFPRGFVNDKYANDDKALVYRDSVVNRTLIPKILNIKIGKKAPSKYLQQIQKVNPNLDKCLEDHLIPKDIVTGLYDDFFADFMEERATEIFEKLNQHVFQKRKDIEKYYYQAPSRNKETTIKIFRTYLGQRAEATFNIDSQKVKYEGNEYTVSGAAQEFKNKVKGQTGLTANGWRFWKYYDIETQQERFVDDFRETENN